MYRKRVESSAASRNCTVLVAEDNVADAYVMEAAIQEWFNDSPPDFHIDMIVVSNGLQALQYLEGVEGRTNGYADLPMPELIILNINMPVMNGTEALVQIKQHPVWRCIPTVMYSTSDNPTTITQNLKAHANAYLVKPVDFEKTIVSLKRTMEFFLSTVMPYRVKVHQS